MKNQCTQCGGDYIFIDATEYNIPFVSGAQDFVELIEQFGGRRQDITIGYCLMCKEQVLRGPVMTFEGTVE